MSKYFFRLSIYHSNFVSYAMKEILKTTHKLLHEGKPTINRINQVGIKSCLAIHNKLLLCIIQN